MSAEMLLGLVAAACTTTCFVSQVIKAWRTQLTKDISLEMFTLLVFGILLWILYAMIRSDFPLLVGNVITLTVASAILI